MVGSGRDPRGSGHFRGTMEEYVRALFLLHAVKLVELLTSNDSSRVTVRDCR